MSHNRILAYSSSRAGSGAYLEELVPVLGGLLAPGISKIAFLPFASVTNDDEAYRAAVAKGLEALPVVVETVNAGNAKEKIAQSDIVMVGGGNTFKLLHDIYSLNLLDVIRDKVNTGALYVGWSAGANITGPTIGTTNDMPIIAPKSLNALGLLPFQINPHYTNVKPAGHNGETRDQRLEEFVQLNPGVTVVALPEGTALKLEDGLLSFIGHIPAVLFYGDEQQQPVRREFGAMDDLSFLL